MEYISHRLASLLLGVDVGGVDSDWGVAGADGSGSKADVGVQTEEASLTVHWQQLCMAQLFTIM